MKCCKALAVIEVARTLNTPGLSCLVRNFFFQGVNRADMFAACFLGVVSNHKHSRWVAKPSFYFPQLASFYPAYLRIGLLYCIRGWVCFNVIIFHHGTRSRLFFLDHETNLHHLLIDELWEPRVVATITLSNRDAVADFLSSG